MIKSGTEKNPASARSYMGSYEWNYRVLDIVDYIESNEKYVEDKWLRLKNYCSNNNLNWKVIRKMIEYTVNHYFESEEELMNFEYFKRLTKESNVEPEIISVEKKNKPKLLLENEFDSVGFDLSKLSKNTESIF